jgi:site-specific recombinase XerD
VATRTTGKPNAASRSVTASHARGLSVTHYPPMPEGFSAHWLRHAHVSRSLKRNVPVHIVQQTVGHSSLTTTTRYAHVMPDDSSALHLAVA